VEGKEKIPEKFYFSIGEVSKITGLPSHVIRFWESKFPSLQPQKSKGGHRRYQKKEVELILTIKDLLYNKGFTIEGAKRELTKEKVDFNITQVREEIKEIIRLLD